SSEELTPLHVAASRGCRRCLKLLLKKWEDAELRAQDGKRAMDLALEQNTQARVQIQQHAHVWPSVEDPGGGRHSLSFLTEDGTDGSISPGPLEHSSETGPLSSTRKSLLEELESGCGLGDPLLWGVYPPALSIPSFTPWPHADPRGSAFPLQPLASSTMILASDELGEGPRSQMVGGRMGGPLSPLEAISSLDSSPTVLLVHRDHGHPQDSPSDAQGSLDSSPTVLLVHGDHGHLQDSTSDAQGSSHATSTPNPRVLGGASSPKDATVQDSRGCPGPPRLLSDEALRRRLQALGDNPGPVTALTRGLYLRRLEELLRASQGRPTGHSPELLAVLQSGHLPDCTQDELVMAQQFDHPTRSRHWREGLVKSSFNYLLLDPRTTQNLPLRSHHLSPAECFRIFIKAIFYVGKGTRARPYCHLTEALSQHRAGTQRGCPKVRRILEIWASGQGVISVHCFQNTVPAEAYTREYCLLEALGLQTITNQRKGKCYGVAASWPAERRRRLGVHMLHRAMSIFLAEGERQLRPMDIQGGR
ncbi:ANKL1 protein, partial [Galbula dea]|nr:ANKL1 protein [Galbula dea]